MEIRQLRYFITVVKEQSFSKAAKLLHISQPSLSNAIMKLEKEVGIKLLELNTRGLSLTDAGQIYFFRAEELIRSLENTHKELEEVKQIGNGKISIGLIESSMFWFPKVIKKFKKSFPKIEFKLKEILGEKQVIQSLIDYDIHFAVTNQPLSHEEIQLNPIYDERFILLTHEEDELNTKERITIPDLANRDFIICSTGFQTRENVLQAFANEQVTPKVMYEIERFETACSLIEQGLGITFLPESYIKHIHTSKIATHTIHSDFLKRTVYLAYLKDRHLSPAVHELMGRVERFF
ncbi:LysR family transcriptional regulator [Heyndrickxia oleronia]|uniref:LysR family transcriptional regulator n=1 Tax=Heyndrickxia oleronia TaxID=38875 RepID=UPI003F875374